MFLMQEGEKKLRELMATKTVDKKNAIVYLVNCYKNKQWKMKTYNSIKVNKNHFHTYK